MAAIVAVGTGYTSMLLRLSQSPSASRMSRLKWLMRVNRHLCTVAKSSSNANTTVTVTDDGQQPSPVAKHANTTIITNTTGPDLRNFIDEARRYETIKERVETTPDTVPYLDNETTGGNNRKAFLEIFGCQMNVSDAEVVLAILKKAGYCRTDCIEEADVILLVTCSIREGAEQKIWTRLDNLNKMKKRIKEKGGNALKVPKICLLGCMAERLKEKVIHVEKSVDVVAGPDSYKDLPRLLAQTENGQKAVNVLLSLDETYADVMPIRLNSDDVTAYLSIMRGCNNMCTYCIVPFTRGRERSRPTESILQEVKHLSECGVKEITLLGQNVNSFNDTSDVVTTNASNYQLARGFKSVCKVSRHGIHFAELLDRVSQVDPEIRIRFTSPHPKDFPDEVLQVIKENDNVCKSIHMPPQSGNSEILERMRRGYTREAYLQLVDTMKSYIPELTLSGDIIVGFCGETEQQYQDTVSLMELVGFSKAYIYAYSMREKTTAHRKYEDDVPHSIKLRRVAELMSVYRRIAEQIYKKQIGEYQLILVEGNSKRSNEEFFGKNDGGVKVIVPKRQIPSQIPDNVDHEPTVDSMKEIKVGDYVCVKIEAASSQVLKGRPLFHTSLREFSSWKKKIQESQIEMCKYDYEAFSHNSSTHNSIILS